MVVGLAATAIVFFILFWFRRRRKTRRLDHDTAVAATLAAHGFGRQNLIDADDDHLVSDPRTVTPPSGSGSSGGASIPSMGMGGFNPRPVSVGEYGRQYNNPSYLADTLGQTFNPYAGYQAQPHNVNVPGPSNSGGAPNFSLPGPGVGHSFNGHGPKESMGSNEPLLWATYTPPEPPTPVVPPRNPMRLMPGTASGHDSSSGHGDGGSSNGGYQDDDDDVYEALRKRTLKVRA